MIPQDTLTVAAVAAFPSPGKSKVGGLTTSNVEMTHTKLYKGGVLLVGTINQGCANDILLLKVNATAAWS